MIILLGPDNTGKSTLAKQLQKLGSKILHCNTTTVYADYMDILSYPSSHQMVFDRWFFCDIPYATVVRGETHSKFTYQQIQIMNRLTTMYKPLILLCTNQASNFEEREQLSTQDQHDALLLEYRRVLVMLNQPYTVYDWEKPFFSSPEELFELVEKRYTPNWLTKSEDTLV